MGVRGGMNCPRNCPHGLRSGHALFDGGRWSRPVVGSCPRPRPRQHPGGQAVMSSWSSHGTCWRSQRGRGRLCARYALPPSGRRRGMRSYANGGPGLSAEPVRALKRRARTGRKEEPLRYGGQGSAVPGRLLEGVLCDDRPWRKARHCLSWRGDKGPLPGCSRQSALTVRRRGPDIPPLGVSP
jgi:hypothetical protein